MTDSIPPTSTGLAADLARIHDFWFRILTPKDWYQSTKELDDAMRRDFGGLYERLYRDPPPDDALSAREVLALILLFDQLPRNMYRGTARSFASDPLARRLTAAALARGLDMALPEQERAFVYMPLEHSEDLEDQELCVRLFQENTRLGEQQDYAIRHRDIIRRFGRFPHRNALLGRPSTAEETAYLEKGGPTFGTRN